MMSAMRLEVSRPPLFVQTSLRLDLDSPPSRSYRTGTRNTQTATLATSIQPQEGQRRRAQPVDELRDSNLHERGCPTCPTGSQGPYRRPHSFRGPPLTFIPQRSATDSYALPRLSPWVKSRPSPCPLRSEPRWFVGARDSFFASTTSPMPMAAGSSSPQAAGHPINQQVRGSTPRAGSRHGENTDLRGGPSHDLDDLDGTLLLTLAAF